MSVQSEATTREPAERVEATLQGFESRLLTRTKVPAERLGEFLGWDEDQLRREAKVVTRVLKRFAAAVVHSMESPGSMDDFLAELDLKTVSRDHDWRTIFATIRDRDESHGAQFKRAVLIKYLQYLSFRKRLLDFIHARKAGLEETDEMPPDLARESLEHEREVVADVAADDLVQRSPSRFKRMRLGEAVPITVADGDVLDFMLSRHCFGLVGGDHPYVVDENGVTCFVKPGRNMVGRHPESDLTVDANFSDVSRAHLILEWDGGASFRFTDLSSRGTWLPVAVLEDSGAAQRVESMVSAHGHGP